MNGREAAGKRPDGLRFRAFLLSLSSLLFLERSLLALRLKKGFPYNGAPSTVLYTLFVVKYVQ